MQVDFTDTPASLHTRQGTAAYPIGQQCTDQSRSKVGAEHPCSRDELAQQLFKTDGLPRPGWARPHRPGLPGSQQRSRACDACRRQLGVMTELIESKHGDALRKLNDTSEISTNSLSR